MHAWLPVSCLLLLAAAPAGAGAWPRGKGQVFLSVSAETDSRSSRLGASGGLYGEIGLTGRLTLGGQIDRNAGFELFLRRSYTLPWGHVAALSFGAARVDARPERSVTFSGLHWSKSLTLGRFSGWATLDTRLALGLDNRIDHGKADALLGLNLNPRWKAMLALETYRDRDTTVAEVVPSLARRLTRRSHLQLRLPVPVAGGGAPRGGLSLWLDF